MAVTILLDNIKELEVFFDLVNKVLIQEGYDGDYAIVSPAYAGKEMASGRPDGFTVLDYREATIRLYDIERGRICHEKEVAGALEGALELFVRVSQDSEEYAELQDALVKKIAEGLI